MSNDGPGWGEGSQPRYPEYPGEQPERALLPSAAAPIAPGHDVSTPPVGPEGLTLLPAGWWLRVVAAWVDFMIPFAITVVPFVVGLVLALKDSTFDEVTETFSGVDPRGFVVSGLAWVVFVAFDLWNRGLRVGSRGQSLGKQLVGVRVVRRDGTVTGPLEGFFRWLLGLFLQWTFIGFFVDLLWPLGDDHKRTVHDLAIGTFPVRG